MNTGITHKEQLTALRGIGTASLTGRFCTSVIFAVVALLLGVATSNGQGTNPTVSDTNGNTAGGSNALTLNETPVIDDSVPANNTAFGDGALQNIGCVSPGLTVCGANNTATGLGALGGTVFGDDNTAIGYQALATGGGSQNTAGGSQALFNNYAYRNTAFGSQALFSNNGGYDNTAVGESALFDNISGLYNTAAGRQALAGNTTGNDNSAFGRNALAANDAGHDNTAAGMGALHDNSEGSYNAAIGTYALFSATTGSLNLAAGESALPHDTTGSNNIGVGFNSGKNIVAGSYNIVIGGFGTHGDESNTIRIGTSGLQKVTYIAGINSATVSGASVEVNSSGQLGIASSSARYKRDVRDMGAASAALMKLRPVTFTYRDDSSRTRQYGLVAEEVKCVYPDLVTEGADGQLQSVRYLELTAMLLNELQKQARENKELSRENHQLRDDVARIQAEQIGERVGFEERLSSLERTVRVDAREATLSAAVFHRKIGGKSPILR